MRVGIDDFGSSRADTVTRIFEVELRQAKPTLVGGIELDELHSACQGTGKAFIWNQVEDCYGCNGTGLILTDNGYKLLKWLGSQPQLK